jgi:hypothetical protein
MFSVRQVKLPSERKDLIEVLSRNLDDWGEGSEAKFDWLYCRNPFGAARAWFLESASGAIVGASAAFPRRLRLGSKTVEAWVLGDFCVDREHRSLGPALRLQRIALAGVDNGEVDAWYDFPSRSMSAIYGRMGLPIVGDMLRLVYPLRVGRTGASSAAASVADFALRVRDALRTRDSSIEIRPVADWPQVRLEPGSDTDGGIHLERTEEYLDWRYRQDPRGGYTVLSAWRSSACGGCIVFRERRDAFAIVDAFGVQEPEFLRALVLEVVGRARTANVERIVAGFSENHPWVKTFRMIGFRRRESSPYVAYARAGSLPRGAPWLLMNGDRDL